MLKILWFSNTPSNGAKFLKMATVGGGWLKSLDLLLQDHVDLHIAFHYPKVCHSFRFMNTTYHPISDRNRVISFIRTLFPGRYLQNGLASQYLALVEKVGPDVIHIHGTENGFGSIVGRTTVPVVVSIQGVINAIYSKFNAGFTDDELKLDKGLLRKGFKKWILGQSFYDLKLRFDRMKDEERHVLSRAKFIIGRTDWDRRVTSILAKQAAYYHGDELMRPAFYNVEWKPSSRSKLIIHTTTSDSPYKGFETICEAVSELNLLEWMEFEWRVAGVSEQSRIVAMTRKKLGSKYPKRGLKLMGSINEDVLVQAMIESDLFVFASHIDNSPNSLCEAMLLGMPCIATHAGGISSLLRDGVEGVLVQDGDPLALAGAVLELAKDKEKAHRLGIAARSRAMIRHDKERVLGELLAVYRAIVKSTREDANV